MSMTPGRVVFLNGTSSSGKTSIAGELLDILDDGVFFMAVDDFNAMRSKRKMARGSTPRYGGPGRVLRAIAGMAEPGNDIVVTM